MKKLLYLLIVIITFTSCNDDPKYITHGQAFNHCLTNGWYVFMLVGGSLLSLFLAWYGWYKYNKISSVTSSTIVSWFIAAAILIVVWGVIPGNMAGSTTIEAAARGNYIW